MGLRARLDPYTKRRIWMEKVRTLMNLHARLVHQEWRIRERALYTILTFFIRAVDIGDHINPGKEDIL